MQDWVFWKLLTKVCIVFDSHDIGADAWLKSEGNILSIAQLQSVAKQLLRTVSFLHENNIAHVDINPSIYYIASPRS